MPSLGINQWKWKLDFTGKELFLIAEGKWTSAKNLEL